MVSAVSNSGAQTPATQPLGGNPAGNGTTPAFSVSSLTGSSSASAAPAAGVTGAADSGSTGQTPNAANDFRQLFGGIVPLATPYTTKAASDETNFGNPPVPGAPPSSAASPADATTAATPFVPVFQTATVTDGTNVWQMNTNYFADQATAQWLANRYGNGQVVQTPVFSDGGPYSASLNQNDIVLANGAKVNAGLLASYYVRNPESDFPGLAETLIQSQLAQLA